MGMDGIGIPFMNDFSNGRYVIPRDENRNAGHIEPSAAGTVDKGEEGNLVAARGEPDGPTAGSLFSASEAQCIDKGEDSHEDVFRFKFSQMSQPATPKP